jgi:uncharacterized membrane protein
MSLARLGAPIFTFLLFLFTLFSHVRADEDDDVLGEIAVDLLVGVGMAVCESYATCSILMTLMTTLFVVFMLCTCIFGSDRDRRDLWDNAPSTRRVGTTGAGYCMAKGLFP